MKTARISLEWQPKSVAKLQRRPPNSSNSPSVYLLSIYRCILYRIVAKKKSLFDDRPGADMEQLTQTVKQDITDINQQIQDLDSYLIQKGARVGNGQTQAHSKTIVTALQSRLATTSNAFKDILEVRTQNLKAQHERRSQFGSSALAPSQFCTYPCSYQTRG